MDKIKGWELKFPTFLYILFAACPVGQAAEQRFREVQSSSFIQNTHANSPRGLRAAAGRTETAVRTNAVRKNINRCEIRLRTRQKDKLSNSVAVLNYSGNTASIVKRYH